MSENWCPRSASRFESAAPSSSRVESRTVAKRQSSAIVVPRVGTRRSASVCFRRRRRAASDHYSSAGPARRTSWPGPERGQTVGEPVAAGQRELGIELEQGDEHEPPRADLGMGQAQPLGVKLRSPSSSTSTSITRGPCRGPPAARPTSRSTALAASSRLQRLELGLDPHARVEEVGLVEHEPDRLGVVHRRGRGDRDPVRGQRGHRRLEVGPPIAEVGTEPEVPGGAHPAALTRWPRATPRRRPPRPAAPAAARAWPP